MRPDFTASHNAYAVYTVVRIRYERNPSSATRAARDAAKRAWEAAYALAIEMADAPPAALSDSAEICPHCGTNMQGEPIPAADQELFGATHFSRKIGAYDTSKDRTVYWLCPDCGKEWPVGYIYKELEK